MTTSSRLFLALILAQGLVGVAFGQTSQSGFTGSTGNAPVPGQNQAGTNTAAQSPTSLVTDPSYRLSTGDQISVTIYEEPDLASNELIDRDGVAKLSLLGFTKLAGLTVREAEKAIETNYIERKFLKKPAVRLVVTAFAPREIILFGEVKIPGALAFPRDLTSMDIVEVITRAGGFTLRAKGYSVTVSHKAGDKETTTVVDVDAMMKQRGKEFPIYPGDRIIVPERVF